MCCSQSRNLPGKTHLTPVLVAESHTSAWGRRNRVGGLDGSTTTDTLEPIQEASVT